MVFHYFPNSDFSPRYYHFLAFYICQSFYLTTSLSDICSHWYYFMSIKQFLVTLSRCKHMNIWWSYFSRLVFFGNMSSWSFFSYDGWNIRWCICLVFIAFIESFWHFFIIRCIMYSFLTQLACLHCSITVLSLL